MKFQRIRNLWINEVWIKQVWTESHNSVGRCYLSVLLHYSAVGRETETRMFKTKIWTGSTAQWRETPGCWVCQSSKGARNANSETELGQNNSRMSERGEFNFLDIFNDQNIQTHSSHLNSYDPRVLYKGKVVLVHTMKAWRRSKGTAPHILNLSIR